MGRNQDLHICSKNLVMKCLHVSRQNTFYKYKVVNWFDYQAVLMSELRSTDFEVNCICSAGS